MAHCTVIAVAMSEPSGILISHLLAECSYAFHNICYFAGLSPCQTQKNAGVIIPVVLTVYADRSFTFITKTPPAAVLLKQAAGLAKASGEPNKNKVGSVTKEQVEEIAKTKMEDLNASSLETAVLMIEGTARSMGIVVGEDFQGSENDADATQTEVI